MPSNRRKTYNDNYEELQHIREDISSLKSNVVALTRHLKKSGEHQLTNLEQRAEDKLKDVRENAYESVRKLEGHVRERPGQSVTMAFCAGILASYLMGRR